MAEGGYYRSVNTINETNFIVDYKLDYYSFSSTDNNDVKFQIEFFKHTSSDDHTPNTIGFMFNPVKIDGVWYLAVKEATKEATDK